MKRFLIWSFTLILTFCTLVTATRVIGGSIKSSKPTIADMFADSFLGLHGWCLLRMCPGETLLTNVEAILRDDQSGFVDKIFPLDDGEGFGWTTRTESVWTGTISGLRGLHNKDSEKIIDRLDIETPFADFRLGDAVRLFGDPVSVYFCAPHNLSGGLPEFGGVIFFRGGIVASVTGHSSEVRVSPNMMIFLVTYLGEHNLEPDLSVDPWYGFTLQPFHGCGL